MAVVNIHSHFIPTLFIFACIPVSISAFLLEAKLHSAKSLFFFFFFFPSLLSRSELIITSRPFMSWACLGRHHHLPSLRLYAEVPFIPPLLATWRSSHLFGSTRAISGSTVHQVASSLNPSNCCCLSKIILCNLIRSHDVMMVVW